ncbi:LPS biosynthesis glycosyltransferase [Egbenema bharatensis]|uniref:LPS biosynthesis glycosyltransferase n=1 Tax=Egbenema bharatensis TaxID=3463334 RepID=UPI003A849DBF
MVASCQNFRTLTDSIGTVFVLAHRESTQQLEQTLTTEGLKYEVLRQVHPPEFQGFSRSYLCLLNHCRAWQKASQLSQPSLILEADFVPVVGLSQLPLPYDASQPNLGIAWLYACAAQVYSVSASGYAEGFSTAMVAYIVTPQSANSLLELAQTIEQTIGTNQYSAWDSEVDRFLRDRHFKNYIPFRNYGEHGGRPNPEHRQHGLSSAHRADVLYGQLAFIPLYAGQNKPLQYLNYWRIRLQARIKGIGRLGLGKFLRPRVIQHSSVPLRLLRFAIQRQWAIDFLLPADAVVFPSADCPKPVKMDL